ncbi:MAG: peptidoglycan DD-metalloendopeptidase family protein [Clostridia bacterium]|nr:peptidoglycan DD-metalloendopeptidase family protein [Clostridia bacterium]
MSNRCDMHEDAEIQVFTPREILKGTAKKQRSGVFGLFSDRKKYDRISQRPQYTQSRYVRSVRCMWDEFKKQIISGMATAVAVIGICVVVNMLNWSLGFEVIVDGENIGMVTEREVVYDAIDAVKTQLVTFFGEDSKYEKEPVFVRRVVAEDKLSDKKALEDALLSNIDTMVEGYAVYIDGEAMFGVSSEEAAEWVFAKYKQKYIGEEIGEDMVVDFCENTEVKKEFMHIAMLETPEEALDTLSGNTRELTTYTVKQNDTLWDIADKYNTTVEHLLAMNDNISDNIKIGMEIKVEESIPLLSVRSVQTVSLTEAVPYEIEKIKDNSIYEGRTVVAQKGQEGKAQVLARVTKINGVQTDKKVLESETITQPVAQIEKVGTKERPPTTGSGTFIRPTYGSLSSRYGYRWGRNHNGIDIAGSYNSDIKAADGGVVTYAGWMSGYGNYVVINHENGYQTAYGHNASLCVGVGDRVAKGDVIAKMGNTGRSTGTHLHFEVRKNGQYVNPLKYVGY